MMHTLLFLPKAQCRGASGRSSYDIKSVGKRKKFAGKFARQKFPSRNNNVAVVDIDI